MSTPDKPDTPPLTRRRLREIRNTGSTPIVVPAAEPDEEPPAPSPAPLARAAEPAVVAPAPEAQHVDLGVSPLTRRQARAQERIRTASVPVITPEVEASATVPAAEVPAVISDVPAAEPPADETPEPEETSTSDQPEESAVADQPEDSAVADQPKEQPAAEEPDEQAAEKPDEQPTAEAVETERSEVSDGAGHEPAAAASAQPVLVNPALGSDLLAGESPAATLPPSFDQLIARSASATGSIATPNALILSQTPAGAPLVAPVTATGEVLITGTFELPDGLGSVGHAHGTADGKDLDVALIDGELPPSSSPTPIAASAAISTVRNSGEEIIRPPAPEKGSRLMLALIITAGALALALAGVLILAISTGRI